MQLPKNLISGDYTAPQVILCEVDKTKICDLNVTELQGTFNFNAYSEISFTISRTYIDTISGEVFVHPFYDKCEALRLVYLPTFGYFELQEPTINGDGVKETKSFTAYSYEYTLSTKYLSNFKINTGEDDSINQVVLYSQSDIEHSLLNLILEKTYGWSIGHVDDSLKTKVRQITVERESVYDFLMNEVSDKFNCIISFDTVNNTINVYAEALVEKFYGDGSNKVFNLTSPFAIIGSITIGGYKTNAYTYDSATGQITFETAPDVGELIEVTDGYQENWHTDVFVSFDNLAQDMKINYSADDIKTVLTVTGADDLDIREVNMGLPYVTDLSFYYTVDWMGQSLYDAYTVYLQKCNSYQATDLEYRTKLIEYINQIAFLQSRVSTQYAVASVTAETIGTYYIRGGSAPNYYYSEVSLPQDYNSTKTYYKIDGVNLTSEKLADLLLAMEQYFLDGTISSDDTTKTTLGSIAEDFQFVENYTIQNLIDALINAEPDADVESYFYSFLDNMWYQFGLYELQTWQSSYNNLVSLSLDSEWSKEDSKYYYKHLTRYVLQQSVNTAITERENDIATIEADVTEINTKISEISNELLIKNNFTDEQLIRLSAFLREDEYSDSNILITDADSDTDILRTKQELKECGQIELSKLCQPQLSFSMTMDNIYALPDFEPIINQFQLGNYIQISLRSDYIKRVRLTQVDINFDDLTSLSCEFSDLSNLRSPEDIHAELLSKAIQAGKSVASNASYWQAGSDKATKTDVKIQQGLISATTSLKSIDGTQAQEWDNFGIHLRKYADGSTSEYDPEQIWLINNLIAYTDDNWKTTKTALGKFELDGQTYFGLLAEAVISGYIEGSRIRGGTIQIGDRGDGTYNFEVDSDGTVTIRGGQNDEPQPVVVGVTPPDNPVNGQLWVDINADVYELKVYNNGEWKLAQADTELDSSRIYIAKPDNIDYKVGDMWILNENVYDDNGNVLYLAGTMLICTKDHDTEFLISDWSDSTGYTSLNNRTQNLENHVQIKSDGMYLIGDDSSQNSEQFYTFLSSKEFDICKTTSGSQRLPEDDRQVWLSGDDTNIKNAVVKNHLKIEQDNENENMWLQIGNVKFTIESNGSLSIE